MNERQYQSEYQRTLPTQPPSVRRSLPLLIDCDACEVRGIGCDDCVVSVLLGGPPEDVRSDGGASDGPQDGAQDGAPDGAQVTLNDEERRAVEVLAAAGLVPPLRLVTRS